MRFYIFRKSFFAVACDSGCFVVCYGMYICYEKGGVRMKLLVFGSCNIDRDIGLTILSRLARPNVPATMPFSPAGKG